MKKKFKAIKVRRKSMINPEIYETWYRECTVEQAISWFNMRKIEDAAPVYAYCPMDSFDDGTEFIPARVVERRPLEGLEGVENV